MRARVAILGALLLAGAAFARNGAEPLNHYGLVALTDTDVGNRLASRFKAKGQPVFLVHDVNAGLSRNDIMRFADRVVLVDDDVWSTLRAEGALGKIRSSPIVRVQGKATASTWTQRADLVADPRQRMGFRLGAEILRVLEENFGGSPHENQLTLVFDEGRLTLLASAALMDQLTLFPVRRVDADGRPQIVSAPPDTARFTRLPFEYRIWAVDPADPAGTLTYVLRGAIPPGLAWDATRHALTGVPTAAGRWILTAVARNAAGRQDTMSFVLRFRANEPPDAGEPTRLVAIAGREWTYSPRPRDLDHPGYDLRVIPGDMPKRMSYDAETGLFRWRPDSGQSGGRYAFAFAVEDALGARRNYAYELRVTKDDGVLMTEGVKIDLPLDTLVLGRTYTWRTDAMRAAWSAQNIRLYSVTGSDSTRYEHDTLFLRPTRLGVHRLEFTFAVQGAAATQTVLLPVRDDKPPVFLTEFSDWKVQLGDPPRAYQPFAMDPEGEAVSMEAEFQPGKGMEWDGRRLLVDPKTPALYSARFVARDAGGKTAEQWVTFEAVKEPVSASWLLESHWQGSYMALTASRDFGTGRFGVYTPNFTGAMVPDRRWAYSESPFFFLGGNLLGRNAAAQGRTLWGDVGFSYSVPPPPFLLTGGAYLRLNGEWHFPESPLSWIEAEFRTHVHQALFAINKNDFEAISDTTLIENGDSLASGPLGTTLRKGFREDNMRMFSRLEAMGPIGLGFYAGPSIWRNDEPMRKYSRQWMGGTIRYRLKRAPDLYQASLRAGWTPGSTTSSGSGWSWYATMRASLGRGF
jgi:hypothetical protein